jgi:hypothetical protein
MFSHKDVDLDVAIPAPGKLKVIDADHLLFTQPVAENGAIIYTLNGNLEAVEFRFIDNFEAIHNRLHKNGLLNHPPLAAERASLGYVISFPRRFES